MSENNFESILSSVMSNPELMNKISQLTKSKQGGDISQLLPEVMSLISSQGNNNSKEDTIYQESDTADTNNIKSEPTFNDDTGKDATNDDLSNLISKIIDTSSSKSDNSVKSEHGGLFNDSTTNMIYGISRSISKNEPLLCALKPYLSKERQEIIDSIVKLSRIANLMKLVR